jgi:catechol-2,3-dioxygenase
MSSPAFLTARQQGRLAPLKSEHAVLRTADLAPMLDWYVEVLQADVAFSSSSIAFLSYDEQNHRLALVVRPGTTRRDPNSAGLDHLAFTYADLPELVTTYERLKASGISPTRCMNHGSSMSLYYADPDGNQIELKVDNFDTYEEQHAWMRSAAFAHNTIGTPFDMDELATEVKAGVPARQLVHVPAD